MKRLVCLCALLFAGHAMAQTTCSNATLSGKYLATTENATLAAGVNIFVIAKINANGNGTANANIAYTESGGLLNGNTTEALNYTISSDCTITANAVLAGIPVAVTGYISPDGTKIVVIADGVGVALNGKGVKVN